jgi:hypothetical protein
MYLKKAVILAQVANVANNGSGLFRVTTATAHGRTTGDAVYVADVAGNTTANGRWVVTVIDANTLDLQSSTFAGTYTSGGYVCTKQELQIRVTTTPTTALEVTAAIQYRNTLTGGLAGVDTIIKTLPSTTTVTLLVSDVTYDTVVDSVIVYNADGSTRVVEISQANHLTKAVSMRASMATLERLDVTRKGTLAYTDTGRSVAKSE